MPPSWQGMSNAGLLILPQSESILVSSSEVDADASVPHVQRAADLVAGLVDAVSACGLDRGRIGVVGTEVLPHSVTTALTSAFPKLRLENADDVSRVLRCRLSEVEVRLLEHACSAGRDIYHTLLGHAVPGATEGEAVGAAYAAAAAIPGCCPWAFLAASGPTAGRFVGTALPSWNAAYRYKTGDPLHVDAYGFVNGYAYDFGRTVIVGGGTGASSRAIDGARRAVEAMAAALEPGSTVGRIYAVGVDTLDGLDLRPAIGSFGHGIGAGFFRPYINPREPLNDVPLEPPMGVAIELAVEDPDGNYAFYEDDFLLLEDETRCLTAGI